MDNDEDFEPGRTTRRLDKPQRAISQSRHPNILGWHIATTLLRQYLNDRHRDAGSENLNLPKYITFDCYDTLVEFAIEDATRGILGDRLAGVPEDDFFQEYDEMRFQAILGPYQPYRDVLRQTLAEATARFGIEYRNEDGEALVAAVSTW